MNFVNCPVCHGSGYVNCKATGKPIKCAACFGVGFMSEAEAIEIASQPTPEVET